MAIEIKQTSCLMPQKVYDEVISLLSEKNDRRVIVKKYTISDAITEGLILWIEKENEKEKNS